MLEKLKLVEARYLEMAERAAQPDFYNDPKAASQLLKEQRQLEPIITAYRSYMKTTQEQDDLRAMLSEGLDPEMKALCQEEFSANKKKLEELEQELKILLLPRDPNDDKSVIMEIRGGVGGEESALFAHSLYRMYTMYAESKRWTVTLLNYNETELGGVKEADFEIQGAGAVGAALTAMVSGLTLGRKKYEAVQELALRAQAQADALRKRLLAAMEQDTQTFLQVSAAYAMPKQTPEEKQARSSAIEQGLKACTQPPLAVMQLCAEGLELLESLLGKTNATAASDFGVACLSLRAGMQGAWLNVCINTGSLHDAAFAAGARAAGQKLLDTGLPRADRCYAAMLAACSEK